MFITKKEWIYLNKNLNLCQYLSNKNLLSTLYFYCCLRVMEWTQETEHKDMKYSLSLSITDFIPTKSGHLRGKKSGRVFEFCSCILFAWILWSISYVHLINSYLVNIGNNSVPYLTILKTESNCKQLHKHIS